MCRHEFGSVWEIDLDIFIFWLQNFTDVPGMEKCLVASASAIASLFVIFIRDVEYASSIVLGVRFLIIVNSSSSSSSSSSPMTCSVNLL